MRTEKQKLMEKMQEVCSLIFQPQNLLVSVTSDAAGYAALKELSVQLTEGLYADTAKEHVEISLPEQKNEGFLDASQIQYVSLAGNFAKGGASYNGSMRVFRVIMNYEYLWQNIRVKAVLMDAAQIIAETVTYAFCLTVIRIWTYFRCVSWCAGVFEKF